MKILLVEDDPRHIESAVKQFVGHELHVATSFSELPYIGGFDVIFTDMYIPIGQYPEGYSISRLTKPADLFPIGLVVAIEALKKGILCFLLTDSNGHEDAMGFVLESYCGDDEDSYGSYRCRDCPSVAEDVTDDHTCPLQIQNEKSKFRFNFDCPHVQKLYIRTRIFGNTKDWLVMLPRQLLSYKADELVCGGRVDDALQRLEELIQERKSLRLG